MAFIEIIKEGTRVIVTTTLGAVVGLVGSFTYLLMTGLKCINLSKTIDVEVNTTNLSIEQIINKFIHHEYIHIPLDITIDSEGLSPCKQVILWTTVATTTLASAGLLCYYALKCKENREREADRYYRLVNVSDDDSSVDELRYPGGNNNV